MISMIAVSCSSFDVTIIAIASVLATTAGSKTVLILIISLMKVIPKAPIAGVRSVSLSFFFSRLFCNAEMPV